MFISFFYRLSRIVFEIFMRIFFKIHVTGKENIPDAPYIIAPNHESLLDPPLAGMIFKKDDVAFMAKQELFDTPVIGIWSRAVGCIPVNRGSGSVASLKAAIKKIHEGKVICVFPEGTRSVDGELQDAKRGVGFIIAKGGVPVVPVYFRGSGKAFPKNKGFKAGVKIDAVVGKPISPEELGIAKKDYGAISEIVMERISRLKEKFEQG